MKTRERNFIFKLMSDNRKKFQERRRQSTERGRTVTKIAATDFVHATNIRKKGYRSRKGMERRERERETRSNALARTMPPRLAPLFLPIPLNELLPDSSIASPWSSRVNHSISFHSLVIRSSIFHLYLF